MKRPHLLMLLVFSLIGGIADAQTQSAPPPSSATEVRPATTTYFGDTGLWFVPTGEILPNGKWSVTGYRTNWDRDQGFTDISHFIGTFGVGVRDRAEIFGSIRFDTRIDRDSRPIFNNSGGGGIVNEYPLVRQGWSGDQFGDILLGAKFNMTAEHRQQRLASAIRGTIKLPTGDTDTGVSTGKVDFYLDAILSKEIRQNFEVSGYGGLVWRGDPDDADINGGFRWGFGIGVPTRRAVRFTAELRGELPFDDTAIASSALVADDGSVAPLVSPADSEFDATLGVTWQIRRGFFLGAGYSYAFGQDGRENFGSPNRGGDFNGFQARIGYHPGVRVYVPPAAPPTPPPTPPTQAPGNRPPTVKASCDPCTVEVGKTSAVRGDAQDPDGDTLRCRWTAPTGTFANPNQTQTIWTAPNQEGPVPVTITCDDGKGGTASDTVTIQVVRAPMVSFTFEDVHFDFDRSTLRPEALRILDDAVKALQANSGLRIEIEGHTCNIGTAEYNLALGDRRANSVRDYLTSRGIGGDRFRTVSYGEERPKHDNSREETRRLNRRAALVVRIQ